MLPAIAAETFHADFSGEGPRVGVVVLHGFTGSPPSVRPWGEFLAQHGYAVAVPRLPGHGTRVKDMIPTRYDDYLAAAEDAYATLAAKVDSVVVAGLSMGGCLALDLASRHPEVAGAVVVNPVVNLENPLLRLLPVLKHLVPVFPGIGGDVKKVGVGESAYPYVPLKALASQVAGWKRMREENLARVTCPVLMFRSAEDHVLDPSSGRIIMGTISSRDATEVVLEDSYHVATVDNDAELIFEQSLEFVRRVTA